MGGWANNSYFLSHHAFFFFLGYVNRSFMDGLLIGLSSVAGKSAGLVMSVALTIEMSFLGVTFSAGVGKVRGKATRTPSVPASANLIRGSKTYSRQNSRSFPHTPNFPQVRPALRNLLVTGAPLMILVGGAVGALAAAALSANPVMQVCTGCGSGGVGGLQQQQQ